MFIHLFRFLIIGSISITLFSCHSSEASFDAQGHRGCRGLLPENSIPGFINALDLGVTTLELDVVINKDHQVVVSHEPWMSHEICAKDSHLVTEEEGHGLKLYEMNQEQIMEYNCGGRIHTRFQHQEMMKVHKPLLSSTFSACEQHVKTTGRALPFYNIEIKRRPEWDGIYHPKVDEFVRLVMEQVKNTGFSERITIQSFDFESLRIVKRNYPNQVIVQLIEGEGMAEEYIDQLGFAPDVYSPYYKQLSKTDIEYLKRHKIKVIPWTVNEVDDMKKLIEMGVDGIITDYPDRLISLMAGEAG